jgi:hypothetical protein
MEKTATKNIIPDSIPFVKSITEVREEQSSAAQAKTEAAQKSEEDRRKPRNVPAPRYHRRIFF